MPTQVPIRREISGALKDDAAEDVGQAWARLREERNRRLAVVDEMFMRHIGERAAGRPTTLNKQQFERLLAYQQLLRDLPKRTTDPTRPVWPAEPF